MYHFCRKGNSITLPEFFSNRFREKNKVISRLGGVFAIYELLPAFIFSAICIVVVSLITPPPSKEIEEDFEAAKAYTE